MKENEKYVRENFDWFEKHSEELKKEYDLDDEDILIIQNKKVTAVFKSMNEAGPFIVENLRENQFIIQSLNDLKPEMNDIGYLGLDFNV